MTGDSCVIGSGGWSGGSEPSDAAGMLGPFGSSAGIGIAGRGEPSAVRTAFTATCRPGAAATLTGMPVFSPLMPDPVGIKLDVLGPAPGAAGTMLPLGTPLIDGNAAGGANPPAGLMPTGGWFENCGVLPMGAARADGSPCGLGDCCDQAALGAVEAAGIAVGGVTCVVGAPGGAGGRWKFELAPEPAQPVNDPASTNAAHAPIVRVVMRIPLLRADSPRGGRPDGFRPPGHGRRGRLFPERGGDVIDRLRAVKVKRLGRQSGELPGLTRRPTWPASGGR